MVKKLASISPEEKKMIEQNIEKTLRKSDLWIRSKTIGITISRHIEWDTFSIIKAAWSEGKSVCVPKSYPSNHQMIFHQIHSFSEVEEQHHGLLEPVLKNTEQVTKEQIDLLIVPGLLFDEYGFRIGFGGGYYDRFLIDFPNETISLLSRLQLIDKIPSAAYDVPVNYLVVENDIIKRKQESFDKDSK